MGVVAVVEREFVAAAVVNRSSSSRSGSSRRRSSYYLTDTIKDNSVSHPDITITINSRGCVRSVQGTLADGGREGAAYHLAAVVVVVIVVVLGKKRRGKWDVFGQGGVLGLG